MTRTAGSTRCCRRSSRRWSPIRQLAPGVTYVECDLADIETLSVEGAETFKAALLDVIIEYETSNSLD